jgi:hypothetical protein
MQTALATSEGPNSPSAASGDNWVNPESVYVSDDARAVYNTTQGSDYLKCTEYGFSISSIGIIDSIVPQVEGQGYSFNVALTKDGSAEAGDWVNDNQFDNPSGPDNAINLGGHGLWGTTWSISEINASTFGVIIQTVDGDYIIQIDHVPLTIYYHEPPSPPIDAVLDSFICDYPIAGPERFADIGTMQYPAQWTNPDSATLDDEKYATYTDAGSTLKMLITCDYDEAENDALGVEVKVQCRAGTPVEFEVFLTADSINTNGNSKTSPVKVPSTDTIYTFGGPTDTWDGAIYQMDLWDEISGVMLRQGEEAAYGLKVDYVSRRVYYTDQSDSILFMVQTGDESGDDSVTVLIDTTDAYPTVSTYSWRFAYAYTPNTTFIDTVAVHIEESDSLKIATYVKDATLGNSTLIYTSRYFYAETTEPVYQVMPTYFSKGAQASSQSAITPALPASIAVNDYLLLFLETANQAITIPTPAGGTWTEVTNSPQGTGTAGGTGATRLTVFGSRYNGTQTAPTTSDAGDHQTGHIEAYRNVKTTGNPWNITSGGIDATGPATLTITGATTDSANCLVILAVADDWDNSSTSRYGSVSGWVNANLAGITERHDQGSTTGNGGGVGVATGQKATAGNYGNSTVDQNASILVNGFMTIALQGVPEVASPRRLLKLKKGSKDD